ncbi:MAG: ABC transporter permease [Bacteroidota bacterium]
MLKSNLLIALRNFVRRPGYTLLNIVGLTIGIASSLLILLYIYQESSFDKHHKKHDRIYRISSAITETDDAFKWSSSQTPLGPQLKADYPEVEEYVRLFPQGRQDFEYKDQTFFEERIYLADTTLFDVFTINLIKGDQAALDEPNSIVINETFANKVFGNNNPIGEVLTIPDDRDYTVTGVFKDMPNNSHLIGNAFISANTFQQLSNPNAGSWGAFWIYNYVLLKEGADEQAFAAKLPEVIQNYVAVIFDDLNIQVKYELLPLTDIHLKSDFEGEPIAVGNINFLYIFGAVGIMMLLLACINYMNLSTASATKKGMEVGVRKVLGAERSQLITQFLSESVLFTLFAFVLSFVMVLLLIPLFNASFGTQLQRAALFQPQILLGAAGIIVFVGFAAGSYPAFFLSAFRPIRVLKGALSKASGNLTLRRVLVTTQFTITIFMLVGTGIIYDQMQYLRNKDLGFNKDNVMTFRLEGRQARDKYPVLREKLLQNPQVKTVGTSSTTPGEGFQKIIAGVEAADGTMKELGMDNYFIDFDFFPTMGMEILEGRYFDRQYGTDSTQAVLVNEAMVERMAWEEAIGKRLTFNGRDTVYEFRVIGVVKNFHQLSLYDPIESLVFRPAFNLDNVHIRVEANNQASLSSGIAAVERTWAEVFPDQPFEFGFVDSAFMELYEADQIRGRVFTLFSVLMILIACLGLLGLASFTTEQRTKEIGVRKVLGANSSDILILLTRNFLLLVLIGAIPAFIVAWYFMDLWLNTFHYHANMNFWLYGLALVIVAFLTFATTGYFALKAAANNPVKALRYE